VFADCRRFRFLCIAQSRDVLRCAACAVPLAPCWSWQVDTLVEFVFSNCLSATTPPSGESGGKKKSSVAWRSVVTAATKFLVRVVVGAHSAVSAGKTDGASEDVLAERKQRAADIAAKLFATAQSVANTVDSKAADQCTDEREHLLLCASR
jgi:hypothetical protein